MQPLRNIIKKKLLQNQPRKPERDPILNRVISELAPYDK